MRSPLERAGVTMSIRADGEDDPRILQLVNEYQAEWEAGAKPDRQRYVDRYQENIPGLAAYLDGLDFLYREMPELKRLEHAVTRLDTAVGPGSRIGEFEIIRELGRGGMGVVYEALQASLGRRVALKMLPAALATDGNRLRRFAVESQAAAALDHPHIVPVLSVGQDQGIHYYVMKLIDGVSLEAIVDQINDRSPLAFSQHKAPGHGHELVATPDHLVEQHGENRPLYYRMIAQIGQAVADALDHSHQNGIIHRDIKPGNLLLDKHGHIWVTDFGLAQFSDMAAITRTGMAIGTLRYMSPEQAGGDKRRLDHRTDIYSLAITLYELITGQPAYSATEPISLLHRIAEDKPRPLRTFDPKIPVDLETILLKALEKDPRDRYSTAAELADDLHSFLDNKPVRARRPGSWERGRKWVSRHPAFTAGFALALLLLVAVSGVITALSQRAFQAERNRANEAEHRFQQSKRLADLLIRLGQEEVEADIPLHGGSSRRLLLAARENYRELLAGGISDADMRKELEKAKDGIETMLVEEETSRESWRVCLLWFLPIRNELGLSPQQDEEIQKLFGKCGMELKSANLGIRACFHDATARENLFRSMSLPEDRRAFVRLLTAPQRKRFAELFLQFRGTIAFSDPEVVETLALTPEQRLKIRLLQPALFRLSSHLTLPFSSFERPQLEAVPENAMERILNILTADQRQDWDQLLGKPFEFPW